MWRRALKEVQGQALSRTTAVVSSFTSVLVSSGALNSAGNRERNTLLWLAQFIALYSMPLPMKRVQFVNAIYLVK